MQNRVNRNKKCNKFCLNKFYGWSDYYWQHLYEFELVSAEIVFFYIVIVAVVLRVCLRLHKPHIGNYICLVCLFIRTSIRRFCLWCDMFIRFDYLFSRSLARCLASCLIGIYACTMFRFNVACMGMIMLYTVMPTQFWWQSTTKITQLLIFKQIYRNSMTARKSLGSGWRYIDFLPHMVVNQPNKSTEHNQKQISLAHTASQTDTKWMPFR